MVVMSSKVSSSTLVASLLFTLTLTQPLHALPATNYHPTSRSSPRSDCRCITVSDPASSSLLLLEASRSRQWHCAELGPKLEYWRKANLDEFEATWNDLFVTEGEDALPTLKSSSQQPQPLPTNVLMEMAGGRRRVPGSPGQRIICRARKEYLEQQHELEDDWTDNGLIIVTFFIVLVILGCVAELVELLLYKMNIFHWGYRQPIFLSGSEKMLWASSGTTVIDRSRSDDDYQHAYEQPVL